MTQNFALAAALRDLRTIEHDLRERANRLSDFVEQVNDLLEKDPGQVEAFLDPRHPFGANLAQAIYKAGRADRQHQHAASAVQNFVTAVAMEQQRAKDAEVPM